MNFVCFNGELVPSNQPVFTVANRGFKYGDGVFETIKVHQGTIPFAALHFERLFLSLQLLKIKSSFDAEQITEAILHLCEKNDCTDLARVRLAVYRDRDNLSAFVIEAVPLSKDANDWNDKGFITDLYPYARKSKDAIANLKTANFLAYVLADLYAKENGFDDCIVLNSDNHICDSSRANIFLIKKNEIFTPALHQGCINGVMRKFLIDGLKKLDFNVHQQEVTEEGLANADEIFLTNAIYGMRWVHSFKKSRYINTISKAIYRQLVIPVYELK